VLEGLFVTASATAVIEALGSAHAGSGGAAARAQEMRIAVVGHARLARALASAKIGDTALEVIPVGLTARAAKRFPNAVATLADNDARSLAAVIGVDVATLADWVATLADWTRCVRDGGAIVFVDRGHATEASRRALCAGLGELEQRHAGRSVITSGLVTHLDD
jgi:hypothetical protein